MRWLIPAAGLALAGCNIPSEFLQRMESQAKYEYYETSEFWADGRAMRTPPEGTVPRERPVGNPGLTTGRVNGTLVSSIPLELNHEVLALGQKKYNIVCSQCHGRLGDGNSVVAENMALRLPPSLLQLSDKPDGHFFVAVTEGYGVMPSFAGELNIQERWAVVAYVRALQQARNSQAGGQPLPQENR
ncbi:cytochrome c [Vitiosangium sp. GDMCC 1.1324]|uniref:c-type cytochrome n=1 Tax=Vitiosangium sp. (strain GDMCC 1.1324) TaxID=2138576 RepID=UPI000D3AD70D|nr:cytochrome c [Vitiosangium sp. GDMCC 1.1324]PTL84032.1 cytochrome C oxidase Cbb3 [Vitiosangium sp. GDMCC 1.1324]